jgi:hypothetical protein
VFVICFGYHLIFINILRIRRWFNAQVKIANLNRSNDSTVLKKRVFDGGRSSGQTVEAHTSAERGSKKLLQI